MTGRSHLILGLASGAALAVAWNVQPAMAIQLALFGGLGGLIPDLDHPQSTLSGYIPGSGLVLGLSGIRHRTFTHSLLFVVVLVGAWFASASVLKLPYPYTLALVAGIASHLIADMTTPQGIPLLYPSRRAWRILPRFALGFGLAWVIETLASAAGIVILIGSAWMIVT